MEGEGRINNSTKEGLGGDGRSDERRRNEERVVKLKGEGRKINNRERKRLRRRRARKEREGNECK